MNSYAFVFAALVIAVQGGSLRVVRQTGWGAPPPALPAVDIALAAEGAAVGAGTAAASQGILVVGDGNNAQPTNLYLAADTNALVNQEILIDQVGVADRPNGSTSTLNVVTVDNAAVANEGAAILAEAGNEVLIVVDGADSVSGAGAISAGATTHNQQNL